MNGIYKITIFQDNSGTAKVVPEFIIIFYEQVERNWKRTGL